MPRESLFSSAIRSFFNAFLAMIGILIGLFIIGGVLLSLSAPASSDSGIEMKILPDSEGNNDLLPENTPVVLQISIDGMIGFDITGDEVDSYLRVARKGMLKKDRVKAILLKINSGGGTTFDSDLIYQAIKYYKETYKVPVYAHTSGFCASGAYMIACSADKICASPAAIIGSVGVYLGPMFNVWDLMQQHGVKAITLSEGKYKLKYPTFGPPPSKDNTAASYEDLSVTVKEMYSQFVELVANARSEAGLTSRVLRDTVGAQVFMAKDAQKWGFIDVSNANYRNTLSDLVKAANIEGSYQVVEFHYKRSPVQDLISSHFDLWIHKAKESLLGIPYTGKPGSQFLYHFDPNQRTL